MKSDPDNLGYKVSRRSFSWQQLVRETWGSEWAERDVVYRFSNGAERVDTDNTLNGIYGVEIVDGIIREPINSSYLDLVQRLDSELGQMIGQDSITIIPNFLIANVTTAITYNLTNEDGFILITEQ